MSTQAGYSDVLLSSLAEACTLGMTQPDNTLCKVATDDFTTSAKPPNGGYGAIPRQALMASFLA